jgi:hypothetical protein
VRALLGSLAAAALFASAARAEQTAVRAEQTAVRAEQTAVRAEQTAVPAAPPRFRLGLRTGFGVPYGRYAQVRTLASFRDADVNHLSDDIHGVIPLWLDAGYRLSPHWVLGGYFTFGLVLPKVAPAMNPLGGGCPQDFDCAATGLRAGIQAEYAFLTGPVRPWLGLGLGYEWVHTQIQGQMLDLELATWHSGPELLQLQAGTDFSLSPGFALGPFLTFSAMQYTSCSLQLSGQSQSCELDDQAWHGWLLLGARGSLEL